MEIILGDVNALDIITLMEGVCVEQHIMDVITVTLTNLNVERQLVGIQGEKTYEKQVTM